MMLQLQVELLVVGVGVAAESCPDAGLLAWFGGVSPC